MSTIDNPEVTELKDLSLGELGEAIQGSCYMLGRVAGIREAAEIFLKKSGECYALRQDTKAILYREAADLLGIEENHRRQEYVAEYKARERRVFEELDRRQKEIENKS